ncbi:MAG: Fur family transcriptional regulator [Oscillospiraceae bacterium]
MGKYQTDKRKMLTAFLENNPDRHFSAKQIAESIDGISLSAVYRNLSVLEAEEKIVRLTADGSREIYYQYVDTDRCRNAVHLVCTVCGKIFHMNSETANKIKSAVLQSEEFIIDTSETIFYGKCGECTKSE